MKNPTLKLLDPNRITVPFAGVTPEVGVTSIFPNLASIIEYWRLQATIQGENIEAVMTEFYGPFLEHRETLEGASGFMPWRDQGTGVPYMDHFVLATVKRFGYQGMVEAALQVPELPKDGDKFIARAFPDRWTALRQSPKVVRKRNGILHMLPPEKVEVGDEPTLNQNWLSQSSNLFLGRGAVLPIQYVNLFTGERVESDQFASRYTAGAFLGIDRMILLRDQLHQYKTRRSWAQPDVTDKELARFAMVWSQHIFQGTPEQFADMHNKAFGTRVHFERKEDGVYYNGQRVGEYVDPSSVKRNAHTVARLLRERPYREGETRQESLDRRLEPVGLEYEVQVRPVHPKKSPVHPVHFNESVVVDGICLVRAGDILGANHDVAYVDIPKIPTAKTVGERVRGVLHYFQIRAGFGDLVQVEEAERAYSARQTEIAVAQRKRAEGALKELQQAHDELKETYGKLEQALAELEQFFYAQDHEVQGETRLAYNAIDRAHQHAKSVDEIVRSTTETLEGAISGLIGEVESLVAREKLSAMIDPFVIAYERLKKMVETDRQPQEITEETARAMRRIDYMGRFLENIKFYSKVNIDDLASDGTVRDFAQALEDEVKSYNADIQANNRGVDEEFRKSEVELHIQTEYEEGVYVPGLGARMIVYNLVRNSMEEGATRIDLTVRRQEDQEKSVQVAYRDYTTKPMNEAIARAYERGEASHGQGSHLGLGNKIVRKVLEASRAELQIRPEQDGTTFIFTFGA